MSTICPSHSARFSLLPWCITVLLALFAIPAHGQTLRAVPADAEETLIGKICTLAAPRIAAIPQYHGPWAPAFRNNAKSVWSSSGGLMIWGFYGAPTNYWKVTLPSFLAKSGEGNNSTRWQDDGTYENQLWAGSLTITVKDVSYGWTTWSPEMMQKKVDQNNQADTGKTIIISRGIAPKVERTELNEPWQYWRFKPRNYYDCRGGMVITYNSSRLEEYGHAGYKSVMSNRYILLLRVAEKNFPASIKLYVRCEDPAFEFTIEATNKDGQTADEAVVDQIARIILQSAFEVAGRVVPDQPEPDQQEPAIPQPDQPQPQQVQPDEPEPEVRQPSDRIAGGAEREPDRPKTPAAQRIAAMDELFFGVEDELSGRLILIELLTKDMLKVRSEINRWQAAKKEYNDAATKAKASERLRKLVDNLKHLVQRRTEIITELRQLMNDTVGQVEQAYNSYGFGELDFSAALRVEAARARRVMLFAEIEMKQDNGPATRRAATKMRSIPSMQGASYYVEAMGFSIEGRVVEALETIRSARRMGYTKGAGVPFDQFEADLEIAVLRAIQAVALNEAARVHSDNEAWIGSKARVDALPEDNEWDNFAIMMVEYGYYDAVTGSLRGAAEANVREQQVGIELDDLSSTHVGLGIMARLRRNHTLIEIRDMTGDAFREAIGEQWGRQLSDDQARRYRGLVRHVMQMPDIKTLQSGDILTRDQVLSEPVMQRIKSSYEARVNSIWFRPAQIGADLGNALNGRQMFFTFAGGAVLARVGGLPVGSEAARQALAGAPTVSKFFATSAPAQKATEILMRNSRTASALQGMTAIHQWGQQSLGRTAAVMVGQIAVGTGTSYAAQKYIGDEAVLLLDVLGAMGVDSPEFYHHAVTALSDAGIKTGIQAGRAAAKMASQAQQVRRVINQADEVAERISRMVNTSTGEQAWESLGRQISELDDMPEQVRRGLLEIAENGRRGRSNVAQQMLDDYHLSSQDMRRRIDAQMQSAQKIREVAPRLPASLVNPAEDIARQSERMRRMALEGPPERLALPPGQIDDMPLLPRRRDVPLLPGEVEAPRLQGDVDVPSVADDIDDALTGSTAGATASAGGEAATVGSGAGRNGGVATDQIAPLHANDPGAPLHVPDKLLADDQFTKAIVEYERLLDNLPASSKLGREIRRRAMMARQTQELLDSHRALKEAMGDVTPPAQVLNGDLPTPVAKTALQNVPPVEAIGQAVNGKPAALQKWIDRARAAGEPHLVPIFHAQGGKPTYSTPFFIIDGAGNKVGVAKSAVGNLGHPEGILEDFASRLGESLERNIPRARRNGNWTVMELLPQGTTLSTLNPDGARLLAHRKALLDDMIFSMFLGDGDRHFGNLMVGIDGELVSIDFGLADLMPTHPYRNTDLAEQMDLMMGQYQKRLDDLLATAVPTDPGELVQRAKTINALRQRVRSAGHNRKIVSLYAPHDINLRPSRGSPDFEQFVRETMEKQLKHGTRTWDSGNRMLSSAMTPEGLSKQLDDFAEKIKQLRGGGDDQLKKMLDASFGADHPHREYAEKLLETRLKVMKEVFLEHFGKAPPISLNDADTTVRPCLSLFRSMSIFAVRPGDLFEERRLAA